MRSFFYSSFFCFLLAFTFSRGELNAQVWSPLGSGANALRFDQPISCLTTDVQGDVFIGGYTGDSSGTNVEKWDGTKLTMYSTGAGGLNAQGVVFRLAVDAENNIYAIGPFSDSLGGIVIRWDGISWSKVGELRANNDVDALAVDSISHVYAGGDFTGIGNYVAKWNGTDWNDLGGLNASSGIYCLTIDKKGYVYAAGAFKNILNYNYVARWDGSSWSELGEGSNTLNANSNITALAADEAGNIYVGGFFTNSSGKSYVAKWDGTSWSELGGKNSLGTIRSIAAGNSGNIYAAGGLRDKHSMNYVAEWNGSSWSELGDTSIMAGGIESVTVDKNENVYVAGEFGDSLGYYVARYGPVTNGVQNIYNTNTIQVFPNPNKGNFVLRMPSGIVNGTIEIVNVINQRIYTKSFRTTVNSINISLRNFTQGLYFLRLKQNEHIYENKLILLK